MCRDCSIKTRSHCFTLDKVTFPEKMFAIVGKGDGAGAILKIIPESDSSLSKL